MPPDPEVQSVVEKLLAGEPITRAEALFIRQNLRVVSDQFHIAANPLVELLQDLNGRNLITESWVSKTRREVGLPRRFAINVEDEAYTEDEAAVQERELAQRLGGATFRGTSYLIANFGTLSPEVAQSVIQSLIEDIVSDPTRSKNFAPSLITATLSGTEYENAGNAALRRHREALIEGEVNAHFERGLSEDTPENRRLAREQAEVQFDEIITRTEEQVAGGGPAAPDSATYGGLTINLDRPVSEVEATAAAARRAAMPRLGPGFTDKYVDGDQFGIDGTSFMDMPVEEILRLQAKMIRAGVLNPGDFRPGVWDAGSALGMEQLMIHAASNRDPDYLWEDALTDLTVNPNIIPTPAVYLTPDPSQLAEEARNMIRQRLGRDPEPWLVSEMTRELSTAYRAEWERSLYAQDLQNQVGESAAPGVLESLADSASRSAEFGSTGGIRLGSDLIFPGARTMPDPNRPNHFIVYRDGETTGIVVGQSPAGEAVIVGTTILPGTDTSLPGEPLLDRPVTEVQGIDAFSQVRQLFDQRYGNQMVAVAQEQEETATQRANMLDILSSLNGAMRR